MGSSPQTRGVSSTFVALLLMIYSTTVCGIPIRPAPDSRTSGYAAPVSWKPSSKQSTDSQDAQRKIDVHHHYVPDFYPAVFNSEGGDPSGYGLPPWNITLDVNFTTTHGIAARVFSLSAPGVSLFKNWTLARAIVRRVNEYGANLRNKDPSHIGFFTALPSLLDTAAALEEIRYGYDVLKADGVGIYSRYGNEKQGGYLGSPNYTKIWDELNRRKAVVFIHPTYEPMPLTRVEPNISSSTIDFPHETARTVVDLIVTDTLKNHPNVKVILSHAGGTLPYIVGRVSTSLYYSGRIKKTPDEFMAELKRFYFDTALSGNPLTLSLLEKLAPEDHILFGTDYPYASIGSVDASVNGTEAFKWSRTSASQVNRKNALNLFPRLDTSRSNG